MNKSLSVTMCSALIVLVIQSSGYAGSITLEVDSGTFAVINVRYPALDPMIKTFLPTDGGNGDEAKDRLGSILFFIPDQDKASSLSYGIVQDGKDVFKSITLGPIANLLPSNEPFSTPNFLPVDSSVPLVTNVNVIPFFTGENIFAKDQILSVTNGFIQQTSSITFSNGSSLPVDPVKASQLLLDPTVIAVLPAFTGSVKVTSFDRVQPVPEPATILLLGSGLVGLTVIRKRLRRKGKHRIL